MIHLKKIEGENTFAFSLEGIINQEDVEQFYNLLLLKEKKGDKLKLLAIIKEFSSLESFKSYSLLPKIRTNLIKNIEKYAIISEQNWTRTMMPIGSFDNSEIEIRHFDLNKYDSALTWLTYTKKPEEIEEN